MGMIAYRLKADSRVEPKAVAGTIVYPARGHDYGLANDDTRMTGVPHKSVTLDKAGGYPTFTSPVPDLEQIEVPDFEVLNDEHVKAVCQPGLGCCRYLTMDAKGWGCAKLTTLRLTLDMKVEAGQMRATGDNCEGRRS
jgi:hypothetical protein